MKRRALLQLSGATVAAAALPRIAIGQSTRANTLKFVPLANLSSVDPIFNSAQITSNHSFAVYDTLYAMTSKYEVKPQMAEGHTVSDDGRTWLIRLREGLKFHDGEPVRAQDCVPSIKRWAVRDVMGQTLASFVDSWSAQDDRTIKIVLKRPFSLLADALAKPGTNVPFMMPERLATVDPFKEIKESVGSGPYRFLANAFVPGSFAAYEKFDGYQPRQEPADWATGGKVAKFQRIEWHILPDASTVSEALQNGEVDWWELAQVDLIPLLKQNKDIVVATLDKNGSAGNLRFNHLQPPFNDVRIRRAVLMAVNQDDYMRAVAGNDPSNYTICKAMFPCDSTYGAQVGESAMKGDLQTGKRMLKEAGYVGQKAVILNAADNPRSAPFGDVTLDLLQKLGMNVDLVSTDFGTLLQRRANRGPVEQGGWSAFLGSSVGISLLDPVVSVTLRGVGTSGWPGWFSDPKMEQLIDDFLVAKNEAGRLRVSNLIQQECFSQVPTVPLGQFRSPAAYRSDLKGVLEGFAPFFWNVQRA